MSNFVALLQDACRRALVPGMTFDNQLRLYRSVIALAREVRLRFGAMPESDIPALLAEVCEHASAFGLDPNLWLNEAMQLQRLAVQLSRAVRHAKGAKAPAREIYEQNPMHPENPVQAPPPEPAATTEPKRPAPHREEPLTEESQQNPMHREKPVQALPPEPAATTEPERPAPHREESLTEESQQNPMHREKPVHALPLEPAATAEPKRPAPHREEPLTEESQQNPMHRETEADDDRLSAWRQDHKADRDQRAHELLRTVFDDRVRTKIEAMNQRDREAAAAA